MVIIFSLELWDVRVANDTGTEFDICFVWHKSEFFLFLKISLNSQDSFGWFFVPTTDSLIQGYESALISCDTTTSDIPVIVLNEKLFFKYCVQNQWQPISMYITYGGVLGGKTNKSSMMEHFGAN